MKARTDVSLASISRNVILEDALLTENVTRLIRQRLVHYRLQAVLPDLFGPVDDKLIGEIGKLGSLLRLSRGEYLCRTGDDDRTLFILLSGRLMALSGDPAKGGKVLGEITAGECVGEMALFTGETRSADVVGIRDSQLFAISESDFQVLLNREPSIGSGITGLIINRLKGLYNTTGSHRNLKNICLISLSGSVSISEQALKLQKAVSAFCPVYCLDSETVDRDLGTPGIANVSPDDPAEIRLETYIDDLESRYRILLFCTDTEDSLWSARCLHEADRVLMFARGEEQEPRLPKEKGVVSEGVAEPGRNLVLLHEQDAEIPPGTVDRFPRSGVSGCFHIKGDKPESYGRVARIITGNAVGVVLSGGGAKGYAHAGVLKALEEAGIEIDMIGGTSMGAVMAAGYAMGLSPDAIIRTNRALFKKYNPFKEYTLPLISVLAGKKLDRMLKEAYGGRRIEDLWLNYFCVSSDLTAAEERVHRTGELWKAVRASMSLPGILVPVVDGESLLVDGGVVNNMPGDIMKEMCPGTVITIDVAPRRDVEPPAWEFPSPWKVLGRKLIPWKADIKVPTILQIMGRTTMLASVHRMNRVSAESAFHLRPPVEKFGMLDTDKAEEIAETGYRYAKNVISSRNWLLVPKNN